MIIRPATTPDLPLIRALERQADTAAHWSEHDYGALFAPDAPKRIALVASGIYQPELCGFVIAVRATDEWEIETVVVGVECRRQGLGSALIREILRMAAEQQARSVLLEVRDSNTAARGLYRSLGFNEIGRRPGYYRDPVEDALLLSFSLAKD